MASRAEALREADEQDWITGEEYARERARLLAQGASYPDAPEFRQLFARVDARDEFLFNVFGKPLQAAHHGRFVAIGLTGRVILGDTAVEVLDEAVREFGAGNFCLRRLGYEAEGVLLSPRCGG